MQRFAGIDLAWSGRKPTGVCVIALGADGAPKLERLDCVDGDALAIAALLQGLGGNIVAGIDAPLIVGDARRAEAELARAYGSRGVYAYAARMDFLERHGITGGPALGASLASAGWHLDPSLLGLRSPGRFALEMFPHATIVALLGAPAALRYKRGRLANRRAELSVFQSLLADHARATLPCLFEDPAATLTTTPASLRGRELKHLEDRLDAVACAIAAFHAWQLGHPGLEIFGEAGAGYIAVPRAPSAVPPTFSPAPSSP